MLLRKEQELGTLAVVILRISIISKSTIRARILMSVDRGGRGENSCLSSPSPPPHLDLTKNFLQKKGVAWRSRNAQSVPPRRRKATDG